MKFQPLEMLSPEQLHKMQVRYRKAMAEDACAHDCMESLYDIPTLLDEILRLQGKMVDLAEAKTLLKDSPKGFVTAPTLDDLKLSPRESALLAFLRAWQLNFENCGIGEVRTALDLLQAYKLKETWDASHEERKAAYRAKIKSEGA